MAAKAGSLLKKARGLTGCVLGWVGLGPSLKLTASLQFAPENGMGWNTRSFPIGAWDGLFSGANC